MKIRVDSTVQKLLFDPFQNVYIGIQCLDFTQCAGLNGLICAECPFNNNEEVDLEDIIKVYLRSVQENEND